MTTPNNEMDENLIYGLIIAANRHPERRMRLRAVRQLAEIPNPQVHNALASLALWDESKQVRDEAYQALKNMFGDDTDAFLKDFMGEEEPLDEEELEGEPEEVYIDEAELEAVELEEEDEYDEFEEELLDEGEESEEIFEPEIEPEPVRAKPMYTEHSPGQSPVMTREGTPWWVWVVVWGGVIAVAWFLSGQ